MVFDKVVLKDAKVAVEEPEEEETVGYRIRKQEPHTKMWRKFRNLEVKLPTIWTDEKAE